MENPKNRKWQVVRSEYLARKPWFTVRHETIALPDGRTIPDYYVFEYPDWVNVTAIDRDGRFVVIDQYRHGLGETSYEIPAGVMEPSDRSPLEAARRELLEETGYGGVAPADLHLRQPGHTEQPDALLPGHRRGAHRRPASRRHGGHPRTPVHARRASRTAPHGPHPAGADGRPAVALFRRAPRTVGGYRPTVWARARK